METFKAELLELLRRNDLLRAAFLVIRVNEPEFDPSPYVERVLELSAAAWNRSARCRQDAVLKVESINHVLYKDFGLEGRSDKNRNVIDDADRYYISKVLDKRIGSPLAITILYAAIAEQIGLGFECLALPSYYVLKVRDVTREFYVDPFDKGRFMTEEEFQRKFRSAAQRNRMVSTKLFEKVSAYQLVARLIQQLKHIYILKGNALDALRTVELLTALFPQSPELTRDRGILYCEMEYFSKAIDDLKFYLKQRPQAEDFAEIKKLTSMLRGYREIVN